MNDFFTLHKKWSFPLKISSVNVTKSAFTDEILNGKLHFLCSVITENTFHVFDIFFSFRDLIDRWFLFGIPEKMDSGCTVWMLGLWTLGCLDSGLLDAWTLDAWMLALWTNGRLDSGQLDAWTLGVWALGLWTLEL